MNSCGWHASGFPQSGLLIGENRGAGDCRNASALGKNQPGRILTKRNFSNAEIFFRASIKRKQASVERSAVRRGAEREAILSRRHSNAHAHKRQALFRLL